MHSAAPIHLAVSFAAMAARGAGIACIGNDRFVSRRKEGRGVNYANDVAGRLLHGGKVHVASERSCEGF
jgi:hypothetical protein